MYQQSCYQRQSFLHWCPCLDFFFPPNQSKRKKDRVIEGFLSVWQPQLIQKWPRVCLLNWLLPISFPFTCCRIFIVYSFLDLSVCRTLLSICLSERIFLVRHKLGKVLNGQTVTYLFVRSVWVPIVSICTPPSRSVCLCTFSLSVCLSVCLVFHFIIHCVITYVSPCCEKPVLSPFVFFFTVCLSVYV